VQCLALVRDDFGMAATRFMRDLEVRIVEGHNFATVDLFDTVHARKVLAEFGRAFGRLPTNATEQTPEQERFLDQAVAGLAQDGEVVSVRLALFAEMVKGKPWTPATLRQVGGTEGVGVAFLEETFSASTAPPPHRLHQKSARAVLQALLPEPGADLKGHMRSHQELQQAAGYAGRPQEFAELLHILDTELRLVTPTDPEGAFEEGPPVGTPATSPSYQLTHDYLVPALRQWLTRKQRETRQGRMELLLAERVSVWSHKQESRQLPGWWEWLNILLWTRARKRTPAQGRMLRAATRRHLLQAAVLVAVAGLFGWVLAEVYRGPVKADHLVESLKTADIERVEKIVADLETCRDWANPKLRAIVAAESSSPKERLHASLALLPVDKEGEQVPYLEQRLLEDVGPEEALVIVRLLADTEHYPGVVVRLQALLKSEGVPPGRRFRAACALARLEPPKRLKPGDEWTRWSAEVADGLVKEHPETAVKWARLLRGARIIIHGQLRKIVVDPGRPESARSLAAVLIVQILAGTNELPRNEQLRFTLETEGKPYEILSPFVLAGGRETEALVLEELNRPSPADSAKVDDLARSQAHHAVFLLQLEDWDKQRGPFDVTERITADRLWPLLQESRDPRLHSLRSYLIHRFASAGVKPDVLLKKYAAEKDTSARRALLLSLGEFKENEIPTNVREPFLERLRQDYRDDPDPGIHSAADWLLRQWKQEETVEEIDRGLAMGKVEENRQWYVTRQGHTLAVIPRPPPFTMGSPEGEPHRQAGETQHLRHIPRSFAIATKEVTVDQFRKFLKANPGLGLAEKLRLDRQPDDSPVLGVTWFEAAQYCRWLSKQEGIRDEESCYPAIPDIKDGMPLTRGYLDQTGYRLPTEAEWECACRAGAVTSRPHGSADALLDRYVRYNRNSQGRSARVGSLKPNDLGMFDMLGNAWEWCHDAKVPYPAGPADDLEQPGPVLATQPRVLRGGGFFSGPPELRSAHRREWHPQTSLDQAGFRVARTWP
jgi:formylglycine-generating enzyme required for sulfatase activity